MKKFEKKIGFYDYKIKRIVSYFNDNYFDVIINSEFSCDNKLNLTLKSNDFFEINIFYSGVEILYIDFFENLLNVLINVDILFNVIEKYDLD
jgi:hypothetical protein